jgi:HPt (histidine-containing phosphotransfer) domain-containing protein
MDDFLLKPFEEKDLYYAISKRLKPQIGRIEELQEDETNVTGEELYDLTSLHKLSNNDTTFIKSIIGVFVDHIPASVLEMQQALEDRNYQVIRKTAHRIKPSIQTFGVKAIEDELKILNDDNSTLNHEKYTKIVSKIAHTLTRVVSDLKNIGTL